MKKAAIRMLSACGRMLLWLPTILVIAYFVRIISDAIYTSLYGYFPTLFPLFDPVGERESYNEWRMQTSVFTILISVIIYSYITVRLDNGRDEAVIARTDGLFRIPEMLPFMLKQYALPDALASAILSLALSLPFIFISAKFLNGASTLASLLLPLTLSCGALGYVGLAVFVFLTAFITRIATYPLALGYYRARWLSGFSLYLGGEEK